jgi:REP element-mobilizing transposase RayT
MARPLRLEFRGALYHVTSRGDGQEEIFRDDEDREKCLEVLAHTVQRFNWRVHAYCLMGNHYHLLTETPDGNLSPGMRHFNGVYTQRFNRRHGRVGHVFQGRYKGILVQKDSYLLELARYIVLNPIRAQMVRRVQDWPWSSYRATAGLTEVPDWLETTWILSAFGQRQSQAQQRYRAFVAEGKNRPSPWGQLKNQIYLGSEAFVDNLQSRLSADQDLSEIPAGQRRPVAKPLDYYARKYRDRNEAIVMAYESGGYSLKAIGEHFGLHYSWVSRIVAVREANSKT